MKVQDLRPNLLPLTASRFLSSFCNCHRNFFDEKQVRRCIEKVSLMGLELGNVHLQMKPQTRKPPKMSKLQQKVFEVQLYVTYKSLDSYPSFEKHMRFDWNYLNSICHWLYPWWWSVMITTATCCLQCHVIISVCGCFTTTWNRYIEATIVFLYEWKWFSHRTREGFLA